MAEHSSDNIIVDMNFTPTRSKTFVLPNRPYQSVNDQTNDLFSKISVSSSHHNHLKNTSSCPTTFHYLLPGSEDNSDNPTPVAQPPAISDARNNSETDSSLREDIAQLSANSEVQYTLTQSLEKIFDDEVSCGTHELFSPTSQQMCTFRIPGARHPSCVEDSDFNSDLSTSREASPFNISDSCSSSMSASNSDFSSTEQKDSKPHGRKAKEGWLKVRRMIMWSPFVQIYKKKYPWIQLAGHHGSFRQGIEAGTILKKLATPERVALEKLNQDPFLEGFVPSFSGVQSINGEEYIQMQDLLRDFDNPSLMDIKIGLRTFHEEEIVHARHKAKWRKDLYEKMCAVDPTAPTNEENELSAISKYRYMAFRESLTSTVDLGFRIEGIKNTEGVSKDFKTLKDKDKIIECILEFSKFERTVLATYISKLQDLLTRIEQSPFVEKHQLIGSSILFLHSNGSPVKANLWMIDFGKTIPVPPRIKINHKSEWKPGNYEDGYIFGLENLIQLFQSAQMILGDSMLFKRNISVKTDTHS